MHRVDAVVWNRAWFVLSELMQSPDGPNYSDFWGHVIILWSVIGFLTAAVGHAMQRFIQARRKRLSRATG